MAIVYTFNPEHLVYTGAMEVPGNPIYPPHHRSRTYVEPPEEREGFIRRWNKESQSWEYVENHDRKIVYDKETGSKVTLKVGKVRYPTYGPIPDKYTDIPPPEKDVFWGGSDWIVNIDKKNKEKHKMDIGNVLYNMDEAALDAALSKLPKEAADVIKAIAIFNIKD